MPIIDIHTHCVPRVPGDRFGVAAAMQSRPVGRNVATNYCGLPAVGYHEMTDFDLQQEVLARSGVLKGHADAVNVTDGAGAKAHMAALAAAAILVQHGIEPVLQFTVRDRNRLALQGDLLGAAALRIHNILCLHGDDPKNGDQPDTKAVYDIDSRSLMTMARHLRNEGKLPSGRSIATPNSTAAMAAALTSGQAM